MGRHGEHVPVHPITEDNLKTTTHGNDIVVLYVWAEWCEPCVKFAPIFERCAGIHKDVFFGKLNAESRGTLLQDLQIRSIPSLMVFRGDVMLYRQVG
ncbi:MAG TPA: thioredoxin, partial [Deltaproteobacteria bacterium]|nr:thioredoxin [Deltaproteobacteria bacterium]